MPIASDLPAALIFDMDGVLVNSNPFHLEKWEAMLTAHHIPYDPAKLPKQILGQRNDKILRVFFGPGLDDAACRRLSEELETTFRHAFAPHAQPLAGLRELVTECHAAHLPMAVASSAMVKNVEFVVEALGFRPYFPLVVSGDEVSHPKPHPEIYLQTAARLGKDPAACVAFEDSFVGIEAAKRAGMKCVAVASTFPPEELRGLTDADDCVRNFEELSLERLRRLFGE